MASAGSDRWLVFIDTNIFLDFYRQGGESAARQLAALDRHSTALITNAQVKMEFLKNRQKVIVDSLGKMQKPSKMSVPPILADFAPSRNLQDNLDAAGKAYAEVRDKIEAILNDPEHHDPVFKDLSRLFDSASPLNLTADHERSGEIHKLARDRFALGQPPRKSSDTSYGDGVNWEWIVACAKQNAERPVLIVSRDGDYGTATSDTWTLNDYLKFEFARRVGPKRQIELSARLTTALKRLDEHVTAEDEYEENRLLAESPRFGLDRAGLETLRAAARDGSNIPNWFSDLVTEVNHLQSAGAVKD